MGKRGLGHGDASASSKPPKALELSHLFSPGAYIQLGCRHLVISRYLRSPSPHTDCIPPTAVVSAGFGLVSPLLSEC